MLSNTSWSKREISSAYMYIIIGCFDSYRKTATISLYPFKLPPTTTGICKI